MTKRVFATKSLAALSLLLFAATVFSPTALSTTFSERQRLSPSAADRVLFGGAVSISGDTAIVGRDMYRKRGSAYIFDRSSSGSWTQTQEISASDGNSSDLFGYSVAISGDRAIVGAFGVDRGAGAAYIFEKNSSGAWTQTQRLTANTGITLVYTTPALPQTTNPKDRENRQPPKPVATNSERGDGDWYGISVAISGDTAMVGVPLSGLLTRRVVSGKVYVYERSSDDGTWERAGVLVASAGAEDDDYFGGSIAISGSTAVIGAYKEEGERGAAYVFEKDSSGTWTQVQKLTAGDRDPKDSFGGSVAISGDIIIVGADEYDFNRSHGAGSAYIFRKDFEHGSDIPWTQERKLTAGDAATDDYFGGSVAISGNVAMVGAMRDDSRTGSVYVFTESSPGIWSQTQKITASDAASGGLFGYAAGMSGTRAIIGARGGTGYLFDTAQAATLLGVGELQPEPMSGGCAVSGETRETRGSLATLALAVLVPFIGRFRKKDAV